MTTTEGTALAADTRVRIEAALQRLAQAREHAEKSLHDTRTLNLSMATSYGSELCAGQMEGEEKELRDLIAQIKAEQGALQACLTGEFSLDPQGEAFEIRILDEDIAAKTARRDALTERVAKRTRLRALIGI
ncbi:MAG: hypothetical protein RLZZ324_1246 [Candidatus Parcubacteria bacterium]|jgi:uncharacterized protein YukE